MRWAVACLAATLIGCPHRAAQPVAPPVSSTCSDAARDTGVKLAVGGDIPDPVVAAEVARRLCPRLAELARCISVVHGQRADENGTVNVSLGLAKYGLKPVVVTGGSLADRFRDCIVSSLEVFSEGSFPEPVDITLSIVAGASPPLAADAKSTLGRLAPEVIKQLIRQHFPAFRACYERRLASEPSLDGAVSVRFIVDVTGAVINAEINETGTTIADPELRACMLSSYRKMTFPRPTGGRVMVTYPIEFSNSG